MSVLAVFRPPFDLRPQVAHLPEGLTLAEMAARMPGLPHDFAARGVICINGRAVQRGAWPLIRPKPQHHGQPVEVTFHAPPMGGGGEEGGGKQIFALIASIALTVVTGGIAAGGAARLLGPAFARGTLGATFLAAGVSLAGSLLISALSAPPTSGRAGARQRPNEGAASASGNALEPNAAIPRVIGERKVFPPLACEPLTTFDGPDEVVEAVYVLAGPHRLTDIRIGAAAAEDVPGVQIETREGWPGDADIRMITRQGRTEAVQAELVGHTVDEDNAQALDQFTDLALALPQAQIVATRNAPDEHQIQLMFPQGLHYQGSESVRLRVPLRLRIRPKGGTTWRNLPELHFQAANPRQLRATIRLIWENRIADPQASNSEGFVEARRSCPDQSVSPAGGGWTADSYFGTSGDAYLTTANLATTGVLRTELSRHEARIYLSPADFTPGRWEVEIIRGVAITSSLYAPATYTVSGSVWALFGYRTGAANTIAASRAGRTDTLYLLRSVSIRNELPVRGGNLSFIAVKARNRQLDAVSVVAGGWVPDWNGTAWATWAVTSNPAPHLRDIYAGLLNAKPVPGDIIDDAELVAWRADCTAQGYTCNHLSEDESLAEVARIVASCGYARPRMSEVYGVVRDRDRSADVPVQLFTPRNSRGLSFEKALPDLPDGFRVTFPDAADDFNPRQIDVGRSGNDSLRLPEMLTLEGITTEAAARARAAFDLRQAELRSTFWSLTAPVEAIVCQRGDLVAVTHDLLSRWMASGRVVAQMLNDAGDVTAIRLDASVDLVNEPNVFAVTDVFAVADVFVLGQTSGVVIRSDDGPAITSALTNATGQADWLTLATPLDPADVPDGALVAVGLSDQVTRRMIVYAIEPQEDLTAALTLVDEAPELFA